MVAGDFNAEFGRASDGGRADVLGPFGLPRRSTREGNGWIGVVHMVFSTRRVSMNRGLEGHGGTPGIVPNMCWIIFYWTNDTAGTWFHVRQSI